MLRHILVATDFSENAHNALRYAVQLAVDVKAKLTLLHVTEPEAFLAQTPGDLMDQIWKEVEAGVMKEMEQSLRKIREELPDLEMPGVRKEMRSGLVADAILMAADDLQADLIVAGSHGYAGIKDLFFGNHTASLVSKSERPLLVVPGSYSYQGIRKMAYAIDFQSIDDTALQTLVELKEELGATLEIVHVDVEEGKAAPAEVENFTRLVQRLFGQAHIRYEFLEGKSPVAALIGYMERSDADLLAMKHRHRNFLAMILGRSVSKDLLKVANLPILVFES